MRITFDILIENLIYAAFYLNLFNLIFIIITQHAAHLNCFHKVEGLFNEN